MKFCLFVKIRFVGEEDIAWFTKTFRRMADEELGTNLGSYMPDANYFVDFLRCFPNKIPTKPQSDFDTLHLHVMLFC